MNWYGFFCAIMACWCAVDIGIAIKEKKRNDIIFNAILMVFDWFVILFLSGV
jgi:hypothetical protein